jgi:hypothetical protein
MSGDGAGLIMDSLKLCNRLVGFPARPSYDFRSVARKWWKNSGVVVVGQFSR